MDGTALGILRVSRSRAACKTVPARHTSAYKLKPSARGWMIRTTPIKPMAMASQRAKPTRSCINMAAKTVIKIGAARLMAVALAMGSWNSELRYSMVATASTPARTSTQPRSPSRMRAVAPLAWATASTNVVAMAPLRKISCAAGRFWLTNLTSASLATKQATAPSMYKMPRRLAAAASVDVNGRTWWWQRGPGAVGPGPGLAALGCCFPWKIAGRCC